MPEGKSSEWVRSCSNSGTSSAKSSDSTPRVNE